MRYFILGAGAYGSVIGAYLARGGEEVVLVDTDPSRLEDVDRNGVRLVGFRGKESVPVPIKPPEGLSDSAPLDTVLVCVKPEQLETAVHSILPFSDADTVFLPFLGGLAPFRLVEIVGPKRTVLAVANFECMLRPDGAVETDFHNFIWLGELDHSYTERLQTLQLALSWVAPTLTTKVIQGMSWSKAIYSLEVALSTLVDAPPLRFFSEYTNRRLAAALVRESLSLTDAIGIEPIAFDFFDPNLYRATNLGQGKVMDIWIRHAWVRHEQFRVGLEYDFPAQVGLSWNLSPKNPQQETTSLVEDLMNEADRVGVQLPLTEQFRAIFEEVQSGERGTGRQNLTDLEQTRWALGITVPGPEQV